VSKSIQIICQSSPTVTHTQHTHNGKQILTAILNSYSEKTNKMQQCIKILLFLILNEARHVSGDTPPIIRSLKLHKQPLVLHTFQVVRRAVVGRCQVAYTLPDNVQQLHVCKTRGCQCSFRVLMMGGVSSETCRASFNIRNNKILIHCCILLGFAL